MPIGSSFDPDLGQLGMLAGSAAPGISRALGKKPGVFDRIGDFINSPDGRGALLRSAAATLQGGLGAGITAGANYVDQRDADRENSRRFGIEEALKGRGMDINQQQADQQGLYQQGQLGLGMGELEERGRSNRAHEGLEQRGQDVQVRGQNVGAKVQMRGQDVDRANNVTSNATSRSNNAEDNATQRFGYTTNDERERAAWTQDPIHVAAGIGSKVAGTRVTKTIHPEVSHLWGPNDPASEETTTEVLPMPATRAAAPAGAKPLPATKEELVPNEIYQTSRGPARWDGAQFSPVG